LAHILVYIYIYAIYCEKSKYCIQFDTKYTALLHMNAAVYVVQLYPEENDYMFTYATLTVGKYR